MNGNRKTYYIGDIARDLGLSQRAIRYYEELGFIKPTRTEGRFRTYSEGDVDLLRTVIRFKDLGMSLDEIRALFVPGRDVLTADCVRKLRESLSQRRREFESRIGKYEEGIRQIDHVLGILSNCATCGRPSEDGICEQCLKDHGGERMPLISPLLRHEQR